MFFTSALQASPVCVLVYERDSHPITKEVQSFFKDVPGVLLKVQAAPKDFLACVSSGAEEIVLIAHGFWRTGAASAAPKFQLGYFSKEVDEKGKVIHRPQLFFNRIFEQTYRFMEEERRRTGTNRLKKFRFAACGIESLRVTHPYLTRVIDEFVEVYDEAPAVTSPVLRLLSGNRPGIKRSISKRWLSGSGRCDEAKKWKTREHQKTPCESDGEISCERSQAKFCKAIEVIE